MKEEDVFFRDEYFEEWCKIDDLIRSRIYSLEHLQAVRILLENLPSKEWKRGKSVNV